MLPLILQEGVKARHVLPQAPEDEEGSIISPRWTRMNRIPRLLDWLLSTLTLIPEHELTRPQQILAGLTLVAISRVLPGGQDIGSISGDVAADAGLRDSIKKSEMFVPSQRPWQVCSVLFEDDVQATGGGRPAGAAEREVTFRGPFNLLEQIRQAIVLTDSSTIGTIGR